MNFRIFINLPILFLIITGCESSNKIITYPYSNSYIKNHDNTADIEKIQIKIKTDAEISEELKTLQIRQKEQYKIKIGDVFDIYVDTDPSFNTVGAIVKTDGFISIRILGEIEVEGLTIIHAKDIIEEGLKKYIKVMPRLSLIPVKIKKAQVSVLGEVVTPGLYEIEADMRILDVISSAGGVAKLQLDNEQIEIADLDTAYIIRDNKILPVNFNELIIKGNLLHNILLKDKDYIRIPSYSSKLVYILGEVGTPGKYMLSKNLSLTKLIAEAGGMNLESSKSVLVIRGNLQKPEVYKVSVNSLLKRGQTDFPLRSEDVVYVPRNAAYVYNDVINNILPSLNLINTSTSSFINVDNMRTIIKGYKDEDNSTTK